MTIEIVNNKIVSFSTYNVLKYKITNDIYLSCPFIFEQDKNGNHKYIPANVDETAKTCEIIVNPEYIEENGE